MDRRMTRDDALKLALEAMQACRVHMYENASNTPDGAFDKLCAAIAAIREARLNEVNQELLEALKLADQCMNGSDDPTLLPRAHDAVRAAIAKATEG